MSTPNPLVTDSETALAHAYDPEAFEDHPIERRQPAAAIQWSARRLLATKAARRALTNGTVQVRAEVVRGNLDAEHCYRCGGVNVVWAAASPLWNLVMRGGDEARYGDLVCMPCFAVLAEEAGVTGCWRLTVDPEPEGLVTTTLDGRVWDEDSWLWVDAIRTSPHHADVVRAAKAEAWDECARFAVHQGDLIGADMALEHLDRFNRFNPYRAAFTDDGTTPAETFPDELDDHIAESFRDPKFRAAHDRAVKAEALREAADAVRHVRKNGLPDGLYSHPVDQNFERWLRDRAALTDDRSDQ